MNGNEFLYQIRKLTGDLTEQEIQRHDQRQKKEETEKEYKRIRRNLLRNVKKYKDRGLDVSFFDIPEIPKRITEGSVRKIQQKLNEWKYITEQPIKGEEATKIPDKWARSDTKVWNEEEERWELIPSPTRDFRLQNKFWLQGRAADREEQRLIEKQREIIRKANENNPYYQQALAEGITFDQIPSDGENYARKLLQIAEDALDPLSSGHAVIPKRAYNRVKGYSFNANQLALFSVVKKKARIAIQQFSNIGMPTDPGKMEAYSNRLKLQWFAIATEFEAWLWDSDEYNSINVTPLRRIMNFLTKEDISGYKRKRFAEMEEEEEI